MELHLGKYEILEKLGEGATAEVYRARDTVLGREVALKLLKPALMADPASFARFTKEAHAAAGLFHDHIATVLDMGESDGCYFIAMRYIEGMSLYEYLRKNGTLPWESVKKLAQQIGSALSHAHAQGYIHRDIKPSNIMVSSKGDFVLTDFGLTRAMLESGMTSITGAILGTPPYIPPEIWNGKEASPLSDQYSFACVIDEAITGHSLFSGATPQEIITKHLVNKPEISGYPAEIPENVRFIIQKALSKNCQDRFPDIQSFTKALIDPKNFDAVTYLKQINSQEQSVADKKRLEKIKAKKRRKAIAITVSIISSFMIVICAIGIILIKDRFSQLWLGPAAKSYTQAPETSGPTSETIVVQTTEGPSLEPTQADTPTLIATTTSTSVPTATLTSVPTSTSTSAPTPGLKGQVVPGSGVETKTLDSGPTGLIVYFYRGDGTPIEGKYVKVYTQKQDLSGNWVTDQSMGSSYTDNTGSAKFDLPAGQYIVTADFDGYNWGSASDVEGQASIPVEQGKQTRMILRLGRLKVGFVFADSTVNSGKYVKVHTQQLNISEQWVTMNTIVSGYTNNTGVVEFDLTAGNYIVQADFDGYNWGDAIDVEGETNIPLKPGEEYQLIIHLGRMIVALKDANGNPINGKYVAVAFQNEDISGNPTAGNNVFSLYTDNTGTVKFDLTPGSYAIKFDDKYYYNIKIEAGKITTTDGITMTIGD